MTERQTTLLVLVAAGLFVDPTVGLCQLPWEYYRPRSLASVISEQRAVVQNAFAEDPDRTVFVGGSSFPSLPSIQYVDSARATSAERLELIRQWIQSYGIADEVSEDYRTELLFREGDLEVLLPVRGTLLDELRNWVARGESLTLYVVWVGGLPTRVAVDWVFLVYGFRAGS